MYTDAHIQSSDFHANETWAPMFHLRENRLIECVRPYTSNKEALLISGIDLPIGSTGTMSITATSVNEFDFGGAESSGKS